MENKDFVIVWPYTTGLCDNQFDICETGIHQIRTFVICYKYLKTNELLMK